MLKRILIISLFFLSPLVWSHGDGDGHDETIQLIAEAYDRVVREGLDDKEAQFVTWLYQVLVVPYFQQPTNLDCSNFEGSFDRIQTLIFDGYNCTNSACHSSEAAAGNLDLTAGNAYQSLFRQEAYAGLAEPMQLVFPGEQALSFLYTKLAAATEGTPLPSGGGSPMPVAGNPLSAEQLEAVRLWIRGGAPETADVDGVATLLGCSAPTAPVANKIEPPPAPQKGEGFQLVSGPWTVNGNSENEVCYATYYDLEKMPGYLPGEFKVPCEGGEYANYDGECMAVKSQALTQDPQSHHSIIDVYTGVAAVDDPRWGEWSCLNGPNQGMACDPLQIGVPVEQGGADCGGELYVCGTQAQKSTACTGWGPDDHVQATVSMGGAQTPISTNVYGDGVYTILPTNGVVIWNSHGFNLSSQPTTIEQYNNFEFAAPDERIYRNRQIFDAKNIFVTRVPPFQERTYCSHYTLPQGARLTQLSSHMHQRGVLWETWLPPQSRFCTVRNGCEPNEEPADYVSRAYSDPLIIDYDPPLEYDGEDARSRTLKFCATYDNGTEAYPELLKLNSTSVGSTCGGRAYCVGGASEGAFCGSDDSVCGDGGSCDACIVRGGVTTEDEMFLMLGNYYLVPVD